MIHPPIKRFIIDVIPNDKQRYSTVGDYYRGVNEEDMYIHVSEMGNNKMELLVMIHELIEVILTEDADIKERDILKFDTEFEKNRLPGNTDEPGDAIQSPYKLQHAYATSVERMMCALLGVDWKDYEDTCSKL